MQGTVLRFDKQKGFGFIKPADGSEDHFVHWTKIDGAGRRSLEEGDVVTFNSVATSKGQQAWDVVRSPYSR